MIYTLTYTVEVEANNEEEAQLKAFEKLERGDFHEDIESYKL